MPDAFFFILYCKIFCDDIHLTTRVIENIYECLGDHANEIENDSSHKQINGKNQSIFVNYTRYDTCPPRGYKNYVTASLSSEGAT